MQTSTTVNNQHPLFIKYTRDWLHESTGFSKNYLCRVATGRTPLTRSFIERVSHKLNQAEEELFLIGCSQPGQCSQPGNCDGNQLGQWLEEKCEEEKLSHRQIAIKVGVSHQTISGLIAGKQALPPTLKKLAQVFGGDGTQGRVLLDQLLVLADYRLPQPRGKETSESMAKLMDKVQKFDEPRLKMMGHFADFLIEIDGGGSNG